MDEGVSFAARGNLILLAPPLVIERSTSWPTRSTCSTACWPLLPADCEASHELPSDLRHDVQPARGDARALRGGAWPRSRRHSARRHALFIDGADVAEPPRTRHAPQPDRHAPACWARFALADRGRRRRRHGAPRRRAFPAWRATPMAERARLMRRVGDLMEERVYDDRRRAHARGRQEPHGGARRGAGDRGFLPPSTPTTSRRHAGYEHALPDDPLERLRLAQRAA